MNPRSMLLTYVISNLLGTAGYVCAQQQTSIDLRRDGRVIAGSRKDFLKLGARQYRDALRNNPQPPALAIKLGESLSNKLINSEVAAIAVPQGMTDGHYVIGILIGESTLPEDFPVEQDDFLFLRRYAKSESLAAVERGYNDIKSLTLASAGTKTIQTKLADLGKTVSDWRSKEGNQTAALFAGYLLSELADTSALAQSNELVAGYRAEYERSVDKSVQRAIRERTLDWFQPVDVATHDSVFTVGDLSSTQVKRRSAAEGEFAYLRIWHGRSLVVVPEQPTIRMLGSKPEDLTNYFKTFNPSIQADTVVRVSKGFSM
jgi:hypothetical protein